MHDTIVFLAGVLVGLISGATLDHLYYAKVMTAIKAERDDLTARYNAIMNRAKADAATVKDAEKKIL